MKILTWNINGLKAVVKNRKCSTKELLDYFNVDILCLQETKITRGQLEEPLAVVEGYTSYFSFCKIKQGYSGVVTYCSDKATPIKAEDSLTGTILGDKEGRGLINHPAHLPDLSAEETVALDNEGRAVITEHALEDRDKTLVVINVYCPRVDPEAPDRLPYKINFYTALRERCIALLRANKEVVVCGDFNCSLDVIDSAHSMDILRENETKAETRTKARTETQTKMETWTKTETRTLLNTFVGTRSEGDHLLVDTYRYLHPHTEGSYTCWCTMTESRKLNYGQRIDYITVSRSLVECISNSTVLQDEYGSDHCPVTTELSLSLLPSSSPPSLCSTYFTEFAGRQSKLSSFFSKQCTSSSNSDHDTVPRPSGGKCGVKRTKSIPLAAKSKQETQRNLLSLWENKDGTNHPDSKLPGHVIEDLHVPLLDHAVPEAKYSKLSCDWSGVFKAPPTTPLCPGHREPSVMREVKKNGPNKHRKFYVCARPDGAKTDPKARCDFFQWATKK